MLTAIAMPDLAALLASAAVLMASPGPATLSVAATSAAFGFKRALAYWAGINLGTILVLLAVALGASALLYALPKLALPVTIAASLYMLYLAFRIATAPPLSDKAADKKAPGWLSGFLLAIANPKAYLAIGAAYSRATLIHGDELADGLLKCVILSVAVFLIHTLWAFLGALLTALLRDPLASRAINLALAALLVLALLADFL